MPILSEQDTKSLSCSVILNSIITCLFTAILLDLLVSIVVPVAQSKHIATLSFGMYPRGVRHVSHCPKIRQSVTIKWCYPNSDNYNQGHQEKRSIIHVANDIESYGHTATTRVAKSIGACIESGI
jgi:hypothetical protein